MNKLSSFVIYKKNSQITHSTLSSIESWVVSFLFFLYIFYLFISTLNEFNWSLQRSPKSPKLKTLTLPDCIIFILLLLDGLSPDTRSDRLPRSRQRWCLSLLSNCVFLNLIFLFIFKLCWCADLKNILKKIKKYYFNIILGKKYFKPQLLSQSQTCIWVATPFSTHWVWSISLMIFQICNGCSFVVSLI